METFHNNEKEFISTSTYLEGDTTSSLMRRVFTWMFVALVTSGITAWLFASSGLVGMLFSENGLSLFGWVAMLCPFIMVLAMSFGLEKMSTGTLTLLFFVYAVLMGISLSFIFLTYSGTTIATTFLITSGMFAAMAVAGAVTNMDLSKFGSILFMALIGLIIASLVNLFMHSSRLDWILSIAGVLIFTGLTAYDVNAIKRMSLYIDEGSETAAKVSIYCALSLYLDFINLFLYVLRLFGRSRD